MTVAGHPIALVVAGLFGLGLSAAHADVGIISPRVVDFGEIKMGAKAVVPIILSNHTNAPMNLAGGGISQSDAFRSVGGTCQTPLAAGASCTMVYQFQPRAANGTVEGRTTLFISNNQGHVNAPILLRGTGGESLVDVTPQGVDFGEEMIGQTVSVRVNITNTHTDPVTFAGGGIAAPFHASGSCPNPLPAGASCYFTYAFTPGQIDTVHGSTSIYVGTTNPAMGQSFPISLSGSGRMTPGRFLTKPVAIDFGITKIGTQVESLVSHTNRTSNPMTRAGGGFNNNDNAFSSIGGPDPLCGGGQMPPSHPCETRYRFLPRQRRDHQASTLVMYSQAPDFNQKVPLSFTGRGVGTLARVSPTEIDFGDIDANDSVTVPVVVLNTSPTQITGILGGNVTGAFSRLSSTCAATLASGASCTMTYRFRPSRPGNFVATTLISYQGNNAQETNAITLSGTSGTAIFIDGFE